VTKYQPSYMQAGTYSSQLDRMILDLLAPVAGAFTANDLKVSQHSTPNMTVDVSAGKAMVAGTQAAGQGKYAIWSDALEVVSGQTGVGNFTYPGTTGQAVRHLVVAKVRDASYGGASNDFILDGVLGTPATSGSDVAPAVPVTSLLLAEIRLVYGGGSTITNANITDKRTFVVSTAPTGSVQMFAGSVAPSGWLICDGSAIDRTTYATLFAAISTAYGSGNGSTTFNIPDFRSRHPIGSGQGSGLSLRSTGVGGGGETAALAIANLASHTHSVHIDHTHSQAFYSGGASNDNSRASGQNTAGAGVTMGSVGSAGSTPTDVTSVGAGSGTAFSIMAPFLGINFIIKT
jgi:microcystin-dependent protein